MMTYLQFLLIFVVPQLLFLVARGFSAQLPKWFWYGLIGHAIMAVLYTTPWDNYLVKSGVWSYGQDRVLGVIGYVPIEEYLFFILQTFFTGLLMSEIKPWLLVPQQQLAAPSKIWAWAVRAFLAGAFVIGIAALLQGQKWFYLGLILTWALPIILLHWFYDAQTLLLQWRWWLAAIAIPTLYLAVADSIAIHSGIWSIATEFSTGVFLGVLPLEEAIFFLLTNVMVVQGMMLFECFLTSQQLKRVSQT